MDDYKKLFMDISDQNIKNALIEQKKRERHQNRFNYYNSTIATLAFILSVIAIILEICR